MLVFEVVINLPVSHLRVLIFLPWAQSSPYELIHDLRANIMQ